MKGSWKNDNLFLGNQRKQRERNRETKQFGREEYSKDRQGIKALTEITKIIHKNNQSAKH